MSSSPLSAAGLILDIAGALALALGLMFKRPSEMRAESGTYVGANPYFYISQAKQTADAQVGSLLLVCGFVLQFDGALGWDPDWARFVWTMPAAVVLALGAFVFLMTRWRLWQMRRAVTDMMRERAVSLAGPNNTDPAAEWSRTVDRWGELMGCARREGESQDSFGRRAYGAHWVELKRLGSQLRSAD